VGFYSPCTSTHSGLLCLTPMIDEDDFWSIGGMKTGRGNRSTRRKPTPAPLCPPQNPTWQTRSRTPNRSNGKPATNRLSYGAAFFSPILSPLTTRRVTVEVFDPASTRVFLRSCFEQICHSSTLTICAVYPHRKLRYLEKCGKQLRRKCRWISCVCSLKC
jgi:hypothetical protein